MHIDLHDHAVEDLRRLRQADQRACAAIMAVLEQVGADPKALDKLTTRGDNRFGSTAVNVKQWHAAKGIGNFWRLRALDTPATSYRVVYGYLWQTKQLCVLAVVHKEEFDYDDLNSDLARRIFADWRAL